jgi:hypothetical protein
VPIIPGKSSRLFYGADPIAADLRHAMHTSVAATPHRDIQASTTAGLRPLDIDCLYPSLRPSPAPVPKRSRNRLRRLIAALRKGLTSPRTRIS